MERHFEKNLEELKAGLKAMAERAVDALDAAIRTLVEADASLAEAAFAREKEIDADEIRLESMIIDFIALHQPVAGDLRLVFAMQDAVVDLERIGDHATNIAQSAVTLCRLRQSPDLLRLPEMAELARRMLQDSVRSFAHRDAELARRTIALDDKLDEMNRDMARLIIQAVKEDRELIETGLDLIRISKNLERVGDLSANIAEDAVFLVEAKIARHQEE
ncbi:MAG: phosphate signaling complex protein PhoU [Fibrobacterota bacterium]|nr:phosphate signaling complex protein PhoU [Fibrobacterota bacterium]QQS05012.1 MAG: phosphate signaling complex protein PhoU [Fibrobacterota bacterium]